MIDYKSKCGCHQMIDSRIYYSTSKKNIMYCNICPYEVNILPEYFSESV